VLPSLSRLMDQGIGKGYTHEDHPALANQLFASYAKAIRARMLANIVGRDGLADIDRRYLDFADLFEKNLMHQVGSRRLDESMELGWQQLNILPRSELARLSDTQIARYLAGKAERQAHA
jgi:V/A-type H+-transporting ATPase subunit B